VTFINTRFPVNISYGSSGGPQFQTAVIDMRSGEEKRNINWSYPRHAYDAAVGVRAQSDIEDLIAFFFVVQGRAHSFRWKDWADYKSCKTGSTVAATDQSLGDGDGSETEFQLTKTYTFGAYEFSRNIELPVSGTVVAALDGVETEAFSVDTSTGIITFDSAPGNGVAITVGYEFDVHCRMDTDELVTSLDEYQVGSASVPVIELKG